MNDFRYERRYEVVTYPDGEGWSPGWGGFQARILVNPSGAEVRHESQLFIASKGTDIDAQDDYWKYVARRIPEWNLVIEDETGEKVKVPPPAEDWESLLQLQFEVMIWLRMCIHTAHLPDALGKLQGRTALRSPSGASTTDSTPPIPLRPESSSTPAPSVSSG